MLEDGGDPQQLLADEGGMSGALVAPQVLDRLGISVGDRILLGTSTLEVRGVIRTEPDLLSSGVGFGPRLIVSLDALRATGLVRPGSLITWTYRLDLPAGSGRIGRDGARPRRGARNSSRRRGGASARATTLRPGLKRNIERFTQFLTLVGLTALVVGGVGVANAVASFVDLKRPAIATFKCLGARGGMVFRIYLAQILILATLGIAIGLAVGALLPFIAQGGARRPDAGGGPEPLPGPARLWRRSTACS